MSKPCLVVASLLLLLCAGTRAEQGSRRKREDYLMGLILCQAATHVEWGKGGFGAPLLYSCPSKGSVHRSMCHSIEPEDVIGFTDFVYKVTNVSVCAHYPLTKATSRVAWSSGSIDFTDKLNDRVFVDSDPSQDKVNYT